MIPEGPHDLYRGEQGWFLLPADREPPHGELSLVDAAGRKRLVDAEFAALHRISQEQAEAFHQHAMGDAVERVGAAMGALAQVAAELGSGASVSRPTSLDEALGIDGDGDERRQAALLAGLASLTQAAEADPERLAQVIASVRGQWEGIAGQAGVQAVDRLARALADRSDDAER